MTEVSFWKMHGLGNDYVVIDNIDGKMDERKMGEIARKVCRRKFSVGADGLILVCKSSTADVKMRIFNADGSEAEMCGNGIRCLAKYCFENNIVRRAEMKIETLAGVKKVWLKIKRGLVESVTVDMGIPILDKRMIPMKGKGRCIEEKLRVNDREFRITALSIGNPHCVIFVKNVERFPVEKFGPKIEKHPLFPNRTNVEFAEVVGDGELKIRVWERGVGETLACGTGACASVVAANLTGRVSGGCIVHLLGGDLKIEYKEKRILMCGTAEKAFEGVIIL
ncbi:diaminopimelate epimerase [Candidatus Bathyarchaeota archaeon]|nr:MAG: diaminopimelate epimerase [Candidatus Bathyarchaeota archaeon]